MNLTESARSGVIKPDPATHPLRGLAPFGRRHRGSLARGLFFTCVLAVSRLALPIPLTGIVDRSTSTADSTVPDVGLADPVTLLAAGFVALALVAGMAEHFQRLAFSHFAGRTINDARAAALAQSARCGKDSAGHVAAQVMADSGRVKQGLKGVLNHITLNALMVIGACAALAVTDIRLGVVQLAGAALVVAVAVFGARRASAKTAEHRTDEGLLAGRIHDLLTEGQHQADLRGVKALDTTSSRADTNTTRWEGRTTWATHVVLALSAAFVMALGVTSAAAGTIDAGSLFSVMAYLLVLHGPAVRCARQITRIGSLAVSAKHLSLSLGETQGGM
jgi:ATP-binding cassette subfamily B protein